MPGGYTGDGLMINTSKVTVTTDGVLITFTLALFLLCLLSVLSVFSNFPGCHNS